MLRSAILGQKNILERLSIFRMIFSILLLHTVISEKSTFKFIFFSESYYLDNIPWYYGVFEYWYALNIFLLILNFFGHYNKIIKRALALSLIPYLYLLNDHLSMVTPPIWFYAAFQPVFLFMQLFANTDFYKIGPTLKIIKNEPLKVDVNDYFTNAFFILYILNMFFISAISKTVVSGDFWFLTGDFIKTHTLLAGTTIGVSLVRTKFVLEFMSISTFIFELFGGIILICSKKAYALVAVIFHFLTWFIMDINFVLLWPLYIPIFLDLEKLKEFIDGR